MHDTAIFFTQYRSVDINQLLMADTIKITDNFKFLSFKGKVISCSLCTPGGKKDKVVMEKDGCVVAVLVSMKAVWLCVVIYIYQL